jgi:hypothetical protein
MKAQDFKPGRIYSVIYTSDVPMVNERNGQRNPLSDCQVIVRRVSTVQAAGGKTWTNFKRRTNPDWTPDSDRQSWYRVDKKNSCIVVHKSKGTRYLRGLPIGITKEEYFVGKTRATDKDIETIKSFSRSSGPSEFVLLTLDKLQNVVDYTDNAASEAIEANA